MDAWCNPRCKRLHLATALLRVDDVCAAGGLKARYASVAACGLFFYIKAWRTQIVDVPFLFGQQLKAMALIEAIGVAAF